MRIRQTKVITMIYFLYYTLFNLILLFYSLLGVLAWGTVTTVACILIVIKHFLQVRRGCRCNCRCNGRHRVPQDLEEDPSQSQTQTPPRQRGNFETTILHTPPSQASTPESLTSTPNTVVKTQQSSASVDITMETPQSTTALIKPDDENVSDNTRSKAKKRLN